MRGSQAGREGESLLPEQEVALFARKIGSGVHAVNRMFA